MGEPFYTDEEITLWHGDCIETMRAMSDSSVDAVVTDPPYGLEFMGKKWDGADGFRRSLNPADVQRDNVFGSISRTSPEYRAGHVFQTWCQAWATEALRVLKPGGHMLAFGGTRTWHRLCCAVEDAGFEIRDSIAWMYGSGFPKSLNVTEAMELHLANASLAEHSVPIPPGVYEVTAYLREARNSAGWSNRQIDELFGTNGMAGHWTSQASQPAVPSVRQWAELKAALGFGDEMDELVAELGSTERPEDWGSTAGEDRGFLSTLNRSGEHQPVTGGWGTALKPAFEPIVVARRPTQGSTTANVVRYGTGALNINACRTQMSGEDREKFSRGMEVWREYSERHGDGTIKHANIYGTYGLEVAGPNDLGRWPANVILDETTAAELDRQSGTSQAGQPRADRGHDGIWQPSTDGVPIGPQYGDSGGASRFFYAAKADRHERPRLDEQGHPTVKPLDLMRWLVRLVTPPDGVVLDPFLGSGTTAEACLVEHFRCIGIERDDTYIRLAHKRLAKPIQQTLFGDAL